MTTEESEGRWLPPYSRAKSVDLRQLNETYDEQLAAWEQANAKLQRMQAMYHEATQIPKVRADFDIHPDEAGLGRNDLDGRY
jgi:hypothetical protein